MSKARVRISPSTVVALLALVVAASGGAYAASKTSTTTIAACVRHHGGAVYVANTCHRHDKRLSWNNTGPRGATGASGTPGAPGTPGATGDQGIPGPPGPVDTSQLVHGAGSVSAFGLVTVANGHGAVLKDVPGVGKLDVMSCSASSQNLRFTNTAAVTAHVVISTDTNGAANLPDAHGVAGPGVNIVSLLGPVDTFRVVVALGTTTVADFRGAADLTPGNDCLYWGNVSVGS